MKLTELDSTLLEQRAEIPTGLPPGVTAPSSSGSQGMSDTERNIRNTLNALAPGIGGGVRMASNVGSAIGRSQSAAAATQAAKAAKDAEIAGIKAGLDKAYPVSDFVKTGVREPVGPITGRAQTGGPTMTAVRDPKTGRYTQAKAEPDRKDIPLGTPARPSDYPRSLREPGVPPAVSTRQTTTGVDSRAAARELGTPSTQGMSRGEKAALAALGTAGAAGIGGAINRLAGDETPPAATRNDYEQRPANQDPASLQYRDTTSSSAGADFATLGTLRGRTSDAPSAGGGDWKPRGPSALTYPSNSTSGSAPAAVPPASAAGATPAARPTNAEIAAQIKSIAQSSGISNPNLIRAGQQITLPNGSTYTVRPGDNLWNITKRALTRESLVHEDPELLMIKRLSGI
jgi:hypothetical protein